MTPSNSKMPEWDLSVLFKDINDPKIDDTFKKSIVDAQNFSAKYKNKIANLNETEILDAITTYEQILQNSAKPELFAYLIFAADSSKQEHGAFLQRCQENSTQVSEILIFFDLELTNLSEDKIQNLATKYPSYAHYLKRLVVWKPHRLSENEEKIFNDKAQTSSGAFRRLFEEEFSRYKFKIGKGKKTKELNESGILNLLYDKNQKIRAEASEVFTQGLKDLSQRTTFIYNTLLKDKQIGDKYSKFDNPEQARHMSNESEPEAVEALVEVVNISYGLVHRYYNLKKKIIKTETLYDYDRYAPISTKSESITYENAKDLVLESFKSFSQRYHDYAKQFFDGNWIDVPTRQGKRGGAFCMGCTPDSHPFILLNFIGKLKDAGTLAHELGHGVHDMCMRQNSYLNYGAPLTLAETSSIFAEMLFFENILKKQKSKKQKIALIAGKLEEIFASVHRQIAMFKFERQAHEYRRTKGELSTEDFNQIWYATQKEMLGDSVIITENYHLWWSYITHFFESPFYVYAYAFGELLTLSLYAEYKNSTDKQKFADNMMDNILAPGSSKSPQEILAQFNIDLKDKEFWQKGINEIEKLLSQLETLSQV